MVKDNPGFSLLVRHYWEGSFTRNRSVVARLEVAHNHHQITQKASWMTKITTAGGDGGLLSYPPLMQSVMLAIIVPLLYHRSRV